MERWTANRKSEKKRGIIIALKELILRKVIEFYMSKSKLSTLKSIDFILNECIYFVD